MLKKKNVLFSLLCLFCLQGFNLQASPMPNSGGNDGLAPVKEMAGEITVLFAYTSQAACAAGGVQELKKSIDNGLKLLNEGLSNSNIGYTAKISGKLVEVDYGPVPGRSDVDVLLDELAKPDGEFNFIHRVRKKQSADIVCLIYSGYSMGLAQLFGPFMVTHYSTFGGSYVFPHEFGHNLGAEHATDAYSRQGKGTPNRSFYNPTIDGNTYRTISNNGGAAMPYFSENREINYEYSPGQFQRVKIGSSVYDNASIMRKNAPIAAAWGNKLPNLDLSPNAVAGREVFARTAPKPSCIGEEVNIQSCYIENGLLTMNYTATDAVPFSAIMKDKDGAEMNGTGFKTSLKSGETKWTDRGSFPDLPAGSKYYVTINGKDIVCPIASSGGGSGKIETVPTVSGVPIPPATVSPTKPGVDKPTPTDKPANPTVTPSNPTKPGVDKPAPTDKPTNPTNPKEPTPDKPTISKPDVDPTWDKPAPDSPNRISPKSLAGNMYTVICADPRAKGKVMEFENSKGANTVQVMAGDASNQGTWSFEQAGAETYYIRVENSQARTAAYLDASDADVSGEDGVVILAPKQEGSRGQYWKVTKNSNGTFRITSALGRAKNKCLQADGSKLTGTSADVTLWNPTEASRQSWILKPIE